MNKEIERKFIVNGEFKHLSEKHFKIAQGYLSSNPERTVRIRIKGNKGYITIKGKSDDSGMERFEWEKEIPLNEATQLLTLCESGSIEKIRYNVTHGKHTIEVDVFEKENAGLIMAEIELTNAKEQVELPEWLGEEVTGDNRYYNSYLAKHPFRTW